MPSRSLEAANALELGRAGSSLIPSLSGSDQYVDSQVHLNEARLQQRHGQVIVRLNPGVGVAWRSSELLEDDLAGLP
jgi:hypothetical protein